MAGHKGWLPLLGAAIAMVAVMEMKVAEASSATVQWVCQEDGSLSANDLETWSCGWYKNQNPCQSCTVSVQKGEGGNDEATYSASHLVVVGAVREVSGELVPTQQWSCMSSRFYLDSGVGAGKSLCPGWYTIQGCETQASTFSERVATIKSTIEGVHDIPANCFVNGVRDESRAECTTNFPATIFVERAAEINANGHQIYGRNPATYEEVTVQSCTELISPSAMVEHLVGCEAQTDQGVIAPMGAESVKKVAVLADLTAVCRFWCKDIKYVPPGLYHQASATR
ncbi:hypothetical protein GUITHDRAFT_145847 [Guillardia theta CCMP2712]|uniref:Uncharacterized protein n=1 Tax=Guillardia theta (strain CCMP2712) TaxID=905079 RepID=L1IK49_GUITC|nr:hypothetical protein GUITHDRAFT_145847 [Guillardia theta CCMP2712]EKX36274.1 hypothetical protein GUITHDRAFT_145847 [Guillardia theta CCMP2712]|eukprot:XP_005823254.1 hypothetical protein GUITHDRAFT_145847 [Guillardia theta CCMP2712]